jgi:transposase
MAAAPWIVSDDLWELVQPLLPKNERRFRYPGRRRLPERETLQGILRRYAAQLAVRANALSG